MVHFQSIVVPYIFLRADRVIAKLDKLNEGEILGRVALVVREHVQYIVLFEFIDTVRGRQDVNRGLGKR